jgi:hypothetical protein
VRLTDRLEALLQCFDDARAPVLFDLRSFRGFEHEQHFWAPPFQQVPMLLMQRLLEGFSLRLALVTREPGYLVDAPVLAAVWRPARKFHDGRWVLCSESQAAIRTALATMPAPSVLVDGGHEVWAGWRLIGPISWQHAEEILPGLAGRLGALDLPARLSTLTLPLAGPVRSRETPEPETIEIIEADPTRRYLIAELLQENRHEQPAARAAHESAARRAVRSR